MDFGMAIGESEGPAFAMIIGRYVVPNIISSLHSDAKEGVVDGIRVLINKDPSHGGVGIINVRLLAEDFIIIGTVLVEDGGPVLVSVGPPIHLSIHGNTANARSFGARINVAGAFVDRNGFAAVRSEKGVNQQAEVVVLWIGWGWRKVPAEHVVNPANQAAVDGVVVGIDHQGIIEIAGIEHPSIG